MTIFQTFRKNLVSLVLSPFWRSWQVLIFLGLILGLNFLLWYFFVLKIQVNLNPFILVSGLSLLNIILALYVWNKEKLASFFLLGIVILFTAFMLIFIRYLAVLI